MARYFMPVAGFAAAIALCATATVRAQNPGWQSLFDGKTMSGWTTVGNVHWSVVDGALTAAFYSSQQKVAVKREQAGS